MFRALCLAVFVAAAFEQSLAAVAIPMDSSEDIHARRPVAPTYATNKYYTYDEMMKYLEALAKAFPDRVTLKDVGKSYEKRNMRTITITNGDKRKNKNVIFVDAGYHAREWVAPAAALFTIEQLVVNYAKNADLFKNYDWIILPIVNPDGYTYSRTKDKSWRKTRKPSGKKCVGTDLNRNFDFHWLEKGGSDDPCDYQIFSGSKPFSESESSAVRDIMHDLVNSKRGIMYITIHTYAEKILHPWGHNAISPKKVEQLAQVAEAGVKSIQAATGTGFEALISYKFGEMGGAADDYAFCIGFPLAYTIELSGRDSGFFPPTTLIKKLVDEAWAGIRGMAVKTIEKFPNLQKSNTPGKVQRGAKGVKCVNL